MSILIGLLLAVYLFCSLFLVFVILIQSGKGGGLSSLGGASQGISDALGATGAEKALNKMTTICASAFMILAILISIGVSRIAQQQDEAILDQGDRARQEAPLESGTPQGVTGEAADQPPLPQTTPVETD